MRCKQVQTLLKKLKAGRASANDGLIAEMIKTDCHELLEVIATTFTDILRGFVLCPTSWKQSKVIVLFKKEIRRCYRIIDQLQ